MNVRLNGCFFFFTRNRPAIGSSNGSRFRTILVTAYNVRASNNGALFFLTWRVILILYLHVGSATCRTNSNYGWLIRVTFYLIVGLWRLSGHQSFRSSVFSHVLRWPHVSISFRCLCTINVPTGRYRVTAVQESNGASQVGAY